MIYLFKFILINLIKLCLPQKKKVSIVTFITYVYSGDDHVLTAEKAFVCLTLFDIIKMPLAMLPLLIVYMLEVNCYFLLIKAITIAKDDSLNILLNAVGRSTP